MAFLRRSFGGVQAQANRRMPRPLRFAELYSMFRLRPFGREEWPVLQSSANGDEDRNIARFLARTRR